MAVMSMQRVCPTLLLVSAAVLLALLGMARGQNYHYSNGWHPGKRDGAARTFFGAATDDSCRFRPQIMHLVHHIITDEIARVERSCFSMDNTNTVSLKELLGLETPVSQLDTNNKLDEEVTKW